MRLEGKAKGGYYPTPEPVIERIASFLTGHNYCTINLLDPCAGTGRALALLAERLRAKKIRLDPYSSNTMDIKMTTRLYGIEPEAQRARAARKVLDEVLMASYFGTTISNDAFQLAFVNPPYDLDYEAGTNTMGKHTRLELSFLQRTTLKLVSRGILVYIIPQNQLRAAARHLSEHYEKIACYRFPDTPWASPEEIAEKKPAMPMYERYGQVVLFAQKRYYALPADPVVMSQIAAFQDQGADLPVLPEQPELESAAYLIPHGSDQGPSSFAAGVFDPDRIADVLCPVPEGEKSSSSSTATIWSKPEYVSDHWPSAVDRRIGIGKPLAPLKNGHLAVLAVAGIANGARLVGKDGRRLLIKGYSSKVPSYRKTEDEEEIVETITDKFQTALWGVDLDTGELVYIETGGSDSSGSEGEELSVGEAAERVPYQTMSLAKFMENFGTSLTRQVAESNPPLFQSEEEQLPWAAARMKQLLRRPLGRQRDFILFIVNALVHGGADTNAITRVGKIAEMATGKTYLSLASAFLSDEKTPCFPMLVLCPPILARKWKREAEETIPGVKAVIIRQLSTEADASEFRQFDGSFGGKELSTVGCLERTIAVIKADQAQYERDLAAWETERAARKNAHTSWKATVWWEWKQHYQPGNWINPAEPHEPEWFPGVRPKPVKPLHIVIITSSTAKLGMEWEPVYRMHPVKGSISVPHCCSCGLPLKSPLSKLPKGAEEDEDEKEIRSYYLAEQDIVGSGESRKKRWCQNCGEPLWQYVSGKQNREPGSPLPIPTRDYKPPCVTSTAKRRVALADYIRKRHKGFFKLLVPDEIHEGADGTALYYARQSLQEACKRATGLTGTLCNGYSSSVFPIFYGINPKVRRDFAHNETERWIDLFGVRQKTQKTYKDKDEGYSGAMSKRRIGKPTVREMPGFAPQGLQYVLNCCAFLELSDVAPYLPRYKEEVHVVKMDTELANAYDSFESTITYELGRMLVRGDKSGLAPWFRALLGYPNMPYLGWTCMVRKTGHILGIAPELAENHVYAKERALIDLVQEERDKGRRVMVYAEHTGHYDILSRIQKLLERNIKGEKPLKVTKLYADTVKTIDREAWLREQVKAGCEVLVCNPKLVKVGLDLIEFPTICFFEVPTSTSDMRQASRRSHRPGQTQPVRVVHIAYPAMESRLLRLMAKKMKSSLMVEGQLPGEGLVSFGAEEDESDFMLQLAREVLSGLEQGSAAQLAEEGANELQAMFVEAATLESEKNTYLGANATSETQRVDFEQITTKPLSPAQYSVSDEEEDVPQKVQEQEPQVVVIVPISRITDPWETYRQQVAALSKGKKTRKKVGAASVADDVGTLWAS